MTGDEAEPLSPYFGDYPNGAYWSAVTSQSRGDNEAPDYTVTGDVIRFMWDYGVRIPLWTDGGLLPSKPEWLRTALGLSDPLIEDLRAWGDAMNELDGRRIVPEQAYLELDERAHDLIARLRSELDPRFTVVYKPWDVTYLP